MRSEWSDGLARAAESTFWGPPLHGTGSSDCAEDWRCACRLSAGPLIVWVLGSLRPGTRCFFAHKREYAARRWSAEINRPSIRRTPACVRIDAMLGQDSPSWRIAAICSRCFESIRSNRIRVLPSPRSRAKRAAHPLTSLLPIAELYEAHFAISERHSKQFETNRSASECFDLLHKVSITPVHLRLAAGTSATRQISMVALASLGPQPSHCLMILTAAAKRPPSSLRSRAEVTRPFPSKERSDAGDIDERSGDNWNP